MRRERGEIFILPYSLSRFFQCLLALIILILGNRSRHRQHDVSARGEEINKLAVTIPP